MNWLVRTFGAALVRRLAIPVAAGIVIGCVAVLSAFSELLFK